MESATWTSSNMISISDGNTSSQTGMGSSSGQEAICNNATQTYFRLTWAQPHINKTSTAITLILSSDDTDPSCSWGFKEVVVLAKKCHSYCLDCSGPASTECFVCDTSYYLSGNTCDTACTTGYGSVTASMICVACDAKCLTCQETATNCQTCTTSGTNEAFLLGGTTCVASCTGATVANTGTHVCDACPSDCTTCSSASVCTVCAATFGLLNSTCYSPCPDGYWLNGGTCSPCFVKCSICSTSASTCSACTLTGPNTAYLSGATCVTTCTGATYPSTSPNLCNGCDPKCQVCSGSLNSQCTSCTTSGANEAFLQGGTTCVASCTGATVANSTTHVCDDCPSNCDVCSSASVCTTCAATYGLLSNACHNPCPNSYWLNGGTCSSCDLKCILCSTSATTCSACTLTGSNKAYLDGTSCVATCPAMTFPSTSPNLCNGCDPKCYTCTAASASSCSACTSTAGPDEAFLSGTTCTQSCPTATFPSSATHVCEPCPSDCDVCSSSSACTTCAVTYGLLNSTCHNPCPSSYFLSSGVCVGCDPKCTTCSGTLATECSVCTAGYVLTVSTCDSNCLSGYGLSSTPGVCLQCDAKCTSCDLLATNCSVCQTVAPDVAYLLNLTCLAVCPNGYFPDDNAGAGPNTCGTCHAYCAVCLSSAVTNCSSCASTYTLSGSTCDSACLSGYGPASNSPGVCILCTSPCLTCQELPTNCSTCVQTPSRHYLHKISSTSFECVTVCPAPTFPNNGTLTCDPCPSGCTECNSSSYCFSCNYTAGYAFQNTTNLCKNPCPLGFYKENSTNCSMCNV
jgi:proprotein convertase subtilisin/kexin type 5